MTEYWVSQSKHYCEVCKCWCQGDAVSIKRHEEGPRHRERLSQRLRAKRSTNDAKHDRRVVSQLAAIERAAAVSAKASVNSGNFVGSIDSEFKSLAQAAERGGGRGLAHRSGQGYYEGDATADWRQSYEAGRPKNEVKEAESEEENDGGGEYEIRGVRYFQGSSHLDKFVTHADCDVWHNEDWRSGTIMTVKRFASSGDEEIRRYDIQLKQIEAPFIQEDEERSRLERHMARLAAGPTDGLLRDVKARDIRIRANNGHSWIPAVKRTNPNAWSSQSTTISTLPTPPQPIASLATTTQGLESSTTQLDTTTGIGEWQTVSVREIDEIEEERERLEADERRKNRLDQIENKMRAEEERAAERARALCQLEERRDALNSQLGLHDSIDVYKGVPIAPQNPLAPTTDVSASKQKTEHNAAEGTAASQPVFKKRRIQKTSFRKQTTLLHEIRE